jgi:hypothetical protein
MDSKTLIKALKIAVRDVIKEELTEILREGLQSTITEMTSTSHIEKNRTTGEPRLVQETRNAKNKVQFQRTGFADILNGTPSLKEASPSVSSFSELMNENYRDLSFNSADAAGFGMLRSGQQPAAPQVMNDPETGKQFEVDPIVAKAMTRDYSALMKAIDKKKGR